MKLIKWLKKEQALSTVMALITTGLIVWQLPKMSLPEDVMWTIITFVGYYQCWKWSFGGYDIVPEYPEHEKTKNLTETHTIKPASELVFSQDPDALSRLLEKEMNGD